jgi:peptide chain release factor subunit 1
LATAVLSPEQIDRITRFDANGLPVVSMYVPVEAQKGARRALHSRVDSLLHEIRPLADDRSLDRDARLSVRDDIERIAEAAGRENWDPGTTTALFACSARDLFEEITLPRPVRERVVVDATPWVRPMLAVLDEHHRCCVAVIDKESARVWELYLGEMEEATKVRGRALRAPGAKQG